MLYSVLVRLMGCTALASVAEWDEGNEELAKDGVCVGGGGGNAHITHLQWSYLVTVQGHLPKQYTYCSCKMSCIHTSQAHTHTLPVGTSCGCLHFIHSQSSVGTAADAAVATASSSRSRLLKI